MRNNVLIINGPNLNMLGTREPSVYGYQTLGDIESLCQEEAEKLGLEIDFRQSNSESQIITWIQEAREAFAGIIINPAAYTHTSVAIMDALLASGLPVIEVHLSNIHKREEFRHHSYVSLAANGVICGLGGNGYALALQGIAGILEQ